MCRWKSSHVETIDRKIYCIDVVVIDNKIWFQESIQETFGLP